MAAGDRLKAAREAMQAQKSSRLGEKSEKSVEKAKSAEKSGQKGKAKRNWRRAARQKARSDKAGEKGDKGLLVAITVGEKERRDGKYGKKRQESEKLKSHVDSEVQKMTAKAQKLAEDDKEKLKKKKEEAE